MIYVRAALNIPSLDSPLEAQGRLKVANHTDAETGVIGDREVMLAALLRGEPEVAPGFPRHGVSVSAEGPGELAAGEIAGEPHR